MSYARSTKRTYQPPISHFFSPSSIGRSTPHIPHAPSVIPSVPDTVQASLMRVGMRVRKAVPEGYQTKEKELYTPAVPAPAPSASAPAPNSTQSAGADTENNVLQPQRRPNIHARAELTPFCGIHKIGDLDSASRAYEQEDAAWPSSQDSLHSNVSTESVPHLARSSGTANTRKRWMRDEEEEEAADARDAAHEQVLDPAYFDANLWQAGVWERESFGIRAGERRIAKAVSRRRDVEDDFDDAGFLVEGSDEEMMG